MKRSAPLRRKTPLPRGTRALPRARTPRTRRLRRPGMDPGVRHTVYVRAGGRCDRCRVPLPGDRWECHHRMLRSRGGTDDPTNLLALCSTCHHEHVHGRVAEATRLGYLVPSWADPATTPVLRHGTTWQLPTERAWVPADAMPEGA